MNDSDDHKPQPDEPSREAISEEEEQAGITREKGANGEPYGRQTHGGQSYGHSGRAGQPADDAEEHLADVDSEPESERPDLD